MVRLASGADRLTFVGDAVFSVIPTGITASSMTSKRRSRWRGYCRSCYCRMAQPIDRSHWLRNPDA